MACHTLYSLGAPVGADVGEHHTTVGEQVAEQHRHAVEEIVLGGQHIGFATAVPVERGTEHRLREVEVGLVISPLALALYTAKDGVVAQCLFLIAHLQQAWVAVHQVADNHHGLNGELPVGILFLAVLALAFTVEGGHRCAGEQGAVLVIIVALLGLAVFLYPLHGLVELIGIEDAEINTAQNLDQ